MNLQNNPEYREVYDSPLAGKFYAPASAGAYHMSRMVAAQAQDLYASVGASKEVLESIVKQTLDQCNEEADARRLRTNVGVLMNNLLYRMRYPVDEECGLRMGALLCFMEGEDPDAVSDGWTKKKIAAAHADPDLYTFFLHTGYASATSYAELLHTITGMAMEQRTQTLQSLTLQSP